MDTPVSREERPWGSFEVLREGDGYKVKVITVNPGARLSLQYHRHRDEHWTVVRGTASVVSEEPAAAAGAEPQDVPAGVGAYIPRGRAHRIINRTGEPVVVIEVQTGEYLGEDDIVRMSDDYGRAGAS